MQIMKKNAYIFGISGQDGSYLANLLLKKNFNVIGFTRAKNKNNLINLFKLKIYKQIKFIEYKNFSNIKKNFIKKNLITFTFFLENRMWVTHFSNQLILIEVIY